MNIVNCIGLKCPMPIIQVRLALNQLHKDDELIVYADDPAFSSEFLRFCQLADLLLITKTEHPTFQEYHVKIIQ
jgi:tRNA 2-thiouridine synthesizing protein A